MGIGDAPLFVFTHKVVGQRDIVGIVVVVDDHHFPIAEDLLLGAQADTDYLGCIVQALQPAEPYLAAVLTVGVAMAVLLLELLQQGTVLLFEHGNNATHDVDVHATCGVPADEVFAELPYCSGEHSHPPVGAHECDASEFLATTIDYHNGQLIIDNVQY